MNDLQLAELLGKYLRNECSEEEISIINNWYEKYQGKADFLDSVEQTEKEVVRIKMMSAIAENIGEDLSEQTAPVKTIPFIQSWWFRAVAVVALVLLGTLMFKNFQTNSKAIKQFEIVNNTNKIQKRVLPDGSIVWLKPNSKLEYPEKFSAESRNVAMSGECFFEVTKNPNQPFIISSAHLVTKVWGTSFEVDDHENKVGANVKVVSGKVSVSKQGTEAAQSGNVLHKEEVILFADQGVDLKANQKLVAKKLIADKKELQLWSRINLSFENDKLSTIVDLLNKNYQVNIEIADKELASQSMTADLTELNLPDVLEILKASLNIDYQISGDNITLSKTK